MAPRSSLSTSSRSPHSTTQQQTRTSPEVNEAEFGTPASLPPKGLHGYAFARRGIPSLPIVMEPRVDGGTLQATAIPPSLLRTISSSSDPTLTSIDFSHRALNNESLIPLVTALESNTTVTTFKLSGCLLDDESCQPIAELLSKNCALQALHLDHNSIGVEGAASLSTALITNEVLRTLVLNGNPLGDRGLIYLAKACGHNTTLRNVELDDCGITQTGRVEQLYNLLLRRRIDSNFESLLERLQDDDYRVTGIDLSGRALGDEGIHRLSEALADNTQVRQLWLRGCSVSNSGAKALASCLEQNMSVVDLFLGGNQIGDEGLGYVCDALRGSNSTLVSLEMDDNPVTERGVRDFISTLRKNTSVLVATFENNMKNTDCLAELDDMLEERRKGMNLVSFVVDPEEEDDEGKSGVVNMSVCSSYMPSTYRRAGFRSVASTKHSRSIADGQSVGSHVFSIYNKTTKQRPAFQKTPPQNVFAAAAAAVRNSPPQVRKPPPPPFMPSAPPARYSPPQAFQSHPQASMSPPEQNLSGSDRTSKRSIRSRRSSHSTSPAVAVVEAQPDQHPSARYAQAPTRNTLPGPHANVHPQAPMGQTEHLVVRRSSTGSSGRSSRIPSKSSDPPGDEAHTQTSAYPISAKHESLVKVDSFSHQSVSKSSRGTSARSNKEAQLAHHIAAMQVIQEAVEPDPPVTVHSEHYSQTSEHYDKTMKTVCRRVEMMRLMNYFTAMHYRSRHFWFCFTPISSCIFLTGILSLASAVDMAGLATTILSLCTAFFALMAFVLNFLQTRFGWSSLALSHRSASLELAQVGVKLEQLKEYEGGQLSSRSVSSRSRANAVRDLYRIDVYLSAMQKCTPNIPRKIDQSFKLLESRMTYFGQKYPNAIKARLSEYDEESFDPDDPIPLEMHLDAFDMLCQNIRSYSLFPLFLPNPQNMVGTTTTVFFAKAPSPPHQQQGTRSSGSYNSRSNTRSRRRSSQDSNDSRGYDSRSNDSKSYTRSEDMYTEESNLV